MLSFNKNSYLVKLDLEKYYLIARWIFVVCCAIWLIVQSLTGVFEDTRTFGILAVLYISYLSVYTIEFIRNKLKKRLFLYSSYFDIFVISILISLTGFEKSVFFLLYFPVIIGIGFKYRLRDNVIALVCVLFIYIGLLAHSYFALRNPVNIYFEGLKIIFFSGISVYVILILRKFVQSVLEVSISGNLSNSLISVKNLSELPSLIYNLLSRLLPLHGVCMILKPDNDNYEVYEFCSEKMNISDHDFLSERQKSIIEWAESTGKDHYNEDLDLKTDFIEEKEFLKKGYKSYGIFPLITGNANLGSLLLLSKCKNACSPGCFHLMDNLRNQIAGSIERIKLFEEVKNRASDLEKSYREIEKLNKAKDDFIMLVSHEFFSPLTTILNSAEILLGDSSLNSDNRELIKFIYGYGKKIYQLITKIIYLTKIENDQFELIDDTISLCEILEKILDDYQYLFMEKSIDCKFDRTNVPVFVKGDAEKLSFAFEVIIDNSLKYSDENGKIYVKLDRLSEHEKEIAVIEISDNGIGISEEKLESLFGKFHEFDDINHHEEGLGVGLYIAKQIFNNHEGNIKVESKINEGTKCIIKLPIIT